MFGSTEKEYIFLNLIFGIFKITIGCTTRQPYGQISNRQILRPQTFGL
jgi:hypothetical protein